MQVNQSFVLAVVLAVAIVIAILEIADVTNFV